MWQDKANAIIQHEAFNAYRKANLLKNGQYRKKYRPYTLPKFCDELVKCLGNNDEETAKRIMFYDFLRDY